VSTFLVDLFKVADPGEARGNEVTAREILDEGARRVAVELEGQPEIQATMMDTMGQVYHSLGLYEQARGLLQQGLDQRRRLHGDDHADVTSSMTGLGDVLLAQGQYDEAERLFREAVEIFRRGYPEGHWKTGDAEIKLGECLGRLGRFEEAEPWLLRGYAAVVENRRDEDDRAGSGRRRRVEFYESWGKPAQAAPFR
jgi:non-specific serine/threonine protein kinase/serine/threonine-protein kinase